jgi:hypothetical protein
MKIPELIEKIGHGQDLSTVEVHTVYGKRGRVLDVELDVAEEAYADAEEASKPENFIVKLVVAEWDDQRYWEEGME